MNAIPKSLIEMEPGLTDLSLLLDLLVEQTKELICADPKAQKTADRVHALAGACMSGLNEVFATIDRLRLACEAPPASSKTEGRT